MAYTYNAKLIRVIDGDTIDCMIDLGFDIFIKERVRLAGIDTPEIRTKDLEEKKRGFIAKERVEELLDDDDGSFVLVCTDYNPRGKYGRVVGEIFLPSSSSSSDDESVNQILLKEGLADEII